MYVTNTNTVIALDAGSGAQLWTFTRPRTQGLVGNARSPGNNRSVSVAGDRVFMQTDNAHLLALNRFTGAVLWETEMADFRQNYNATGSLLAVENLVVAGTAGGRRGRPRIPRGLRSGHRQRSVAHLDHPGARRTRLGNLGRRRHRARRRTHLADRQLRPRTEDGLLDRQAMPVPISTATIAKATTCTPARSSRSTSPPGKSNGITRPRRTTNGTGTRCSPSCWWMPTGRASRANSCCRPTVTASCTCWTAPMANCCSPNPWSRS